ncbi:chlorogenic acid esterase precursor [Aureobasidium subglaciale]|nr:chlorogenic acid esterase precursor [Aureobasidium subglaciale]KAI5231564.1 chlorogenic acid esterase precursor [Aureobasidium subglaciale]KAI5234295.1 chlorogenic acid esterase precursor [Aureobasidium subglaciale]KAI5267948.1 chlorogenic acid esterase precursor [Aureobasidium subglaciale]
MLFQTIAITGILRLAYASSALSNNGLTVNTTSGQLQGFVNETAPDVRQFLGIPYAQPPVGALRFAPPVDFVSSQSINATALPNSCMQQFSNGSTIYTAYEQQFLTSGGQSEDCLFLSVWTPSIAGIDAKGSPLPVFLYIPGGGFTGGGQNSMYKIPDKWVQRTQSHIVVVMNRTTSVDDDSYRVNVFGFPNAAALAHQNPGLLDQRKAVEWTYKNIAQFGGDPNRITLWGQSAGGASVANYPYAFADDPIVAGLIADSGATGIIAKSDPTHTNFTALAGLVGCSSLNATAELACVRNVNATALESALSNYVISKKTPAISFTPSDDNITVFSNYTDRLVHGHLAPLPLITGSNTNEGAGFVPFTPAGPGNATLVNTTLSIIACPVARDVARRDIDPSLYPTYRYLYTGNFSNISPVSWFGAYHSAELPLLFGTHDEYGPGNSTSFEYAVSQTMEALWLSFAENPAAGPKRFNSSDGGYFAWPQFRPNASDLVVFAEGGKTLQLAEAGPRVDDFCGL